MVAAVFVNSFHLEYLRPLLKWKITDVKKLRSAGPYISDYSNFCKLLRDFEKKEIVHSFIDPWTKRKYVSLSSLGAKLLGATNRGLDVSEPQLYHDAKVADIARCLLDFDLIDDIELEHTLPSNLKIYPDVVLTGRKNGKDFKIALELELVQKSKERILSKTNHYLNNDTYDLVLYFFCIDSIFNRYRKVISEGHGDSAFNRIVLTHNNTIQTRKIDFAKSNTFFKGKEVRFEELFCTKK